MPSLRLPLHAMPLGWQLPAGAETHLGQLAMARMAWKRNLSALQVTGASSGFWGPLLRRQLHHEWWLSSDAEAWCPESNLSTSPLRP